MAEENKDKKDIEDEEDTLSPEDIDSEMSKAMNYESRRGRREG